VHARPRHPPSPTGLATTALAMGVVCLVLATTTLVQAQPIDGDVETGPGPAAGGEGVEAGPLTAAEVDARIDTARDLYILGDYDGIVVELLPVVQSPLEDVELAARVDLYRLFGLACVLRPQPDTDQAYEAFVALLKLDPRFQFLDGITPPEAIALLERVRTEHPELTPKDPNGGPDGSFGVIYIEREVVQNRFWMVFLPPLGQIQNGDELMGFLLLAVESLALTTNIGSFTIVESLRDANGFFSLANKAAAESFQTAQLVAIGVLVAAVGFGIGHAWYNYTDERVRIRKLDQPPPEFGLRTLVPRWDVSAIQAPPRQPACGECASEDVSGMLLRAMWPF